MTNFYDLNPYDFKSTSFRPTSVWEHHTPWERIDNFPYLVRLCQEFIFSIQNRANGSYVFSMLEWIWVRTFILNNQFLFFKPNLPKKYFWSTHRTNEHHHWLRHIWASLATMFLPKLTIYISWTNFQNTYFPPKAVQNNITTKFNILELVLRPTSITGKKFSVSGSN